ncbi:pneumococcal-type histidine triad protein [Streptococcus equi]|uniref:Histidine triad protein HtpA n=1 Tax=Streptococcus equi subsp. zooepidemicus TaxID=40041 RepID=A0A7Z8ZW93_STRSZ|nr:pneumococcal-type histidine triad protein [Streptococcus equi]VEF06292.1 histidine triad protein HtpA [Streptococcus equi subsp. zooepidemicus]HEL0620971.1 pneumococcal-type histidine triad protein [Streptococcus equi subsp. zooepidemicus]
MTKKAYLALLTILLLFPLSACGFKAQDSTGKKLKSSHQLEKRCKALKKETDKSPNEVSKEEGIAAEQIVVSISDDGFVTSHGDHYHFYNGEVPYDSLFSSELLPPKDYQFDQKDVINEVKNGYVIKTDDHYYFYLKDNNHQENLRS